MSGEEIHNQLMNDINILFSKVFNLNNELLDKSEHDKEHFNMIDVFDFYITSHAQSFLKSYFTGHIESRGLLLNARCIVEGLAIKQLIENGELNDLNFELLKIQKPLIEYQKYEPFFELAPFMFEPEQMKLEYENAKNSFFEILKDKYDEKTINKIIKSHNPFLCDPSISYHSIIRKYLGDSSASFYASLSTLIHPNSNETINSDFLIGLLCTTIELIRNEYSNCICGKYDLNSYLARITLSKDAEYYMGAVKRECRAFEEIQKNFNEISGPNYVSNTFHEISMLIQEMCLDVIFGYTEQAKCKYKCMLEMIVSFYDTYINVEKGSLVEVKYRLLQCHRDLMIALDFDQTFDTDEAYKFYKDGYPNGVNKEKFDLSFKRTTGYTIDEEGRTKTLTDSIKSLYNFFIKNIKDKERKLNLFDTALLDYLEAQMLSHANGYMWFANSGAWGDSNNLFIETNEIINFMFKSLSIIYRDIYKDTRDKQASNLSLLFEQSIGILRSSSKSIRRIQLKPKVHI